MYLTIDEARENSLDETDVFVVGDTTAVIDFCAEEIDNLVGDVSVLVEEHFELFLANAEIFVREFVRDIPADWPEFSSVLDDRVEQAEAEEEFLEIVWLRAVGQFRIAEILVRTQEIRAQALRRLHRHFNPVLQHGNREVARWHARQPESKFN